ncbi:MAG: diguanylate cyclase [Rickettsiales bacterium]
MVNDIWASWGFILEHPDDIRVAASTAEKAIGMMTERSIPTTPQNFTVWYTYVSGREPDLLRAIDKLIADGTNFDSYENAELFEKFFGFTKEGARIQEASEQIDSSVKEVGQFLAEAAEGTENFKTTLENSLDEIRGAGTADDLSHVVGALQKETNEMLVRSRNLEERLKATTSEIDSLRRSLEEVRREAMTDALTGIANRKYFDIHLRTSVLHAMENGSPLSLMLVDIDHFKKFNDNYGHQTGDDVLRLVAHTLASNIKGRDTAARYGGEEFAVILPDTVLETGRILAEKIRTSISSKRFRKKQTGEELSSITISLGLAQYRPGEALVDLIQRSDDALYQAKRTGRNKAVLETELTNSAAE